MSDCHRYRVLGATVLAVGLFGGALGQAWAQTLDQRIEHVRQVRQRDGGLGSDDGPQVQSRMRRIIEQAVLDDVPARDAFAWWSRAAGVPLVLHWDAMENDGVDPDQPIRLRVREIPAGRLLDLIMLQTSPQITLIAEATPWYVRVMTKRQANRHLVLRIYDVQDLVMPIPYFSDAPDFSLTAALSNTSSGGGGQTNANGLFVAEGVGDGGAGAARSGPSRTEQGEGLATLIRDTIEPDLWLSGDGPSVSYFDGRLVVNAPMYVHRQIGLPRVSAAASRGRGSASHGLTPIAGTNTPDPVAGVASE